MTNLQPFEELVEAAKAEWIERHPELSPDNRGIDPNIIINAQAKQLLKANKNAEGHIANHRRDQAKIVELKAENQDLRVRLAKSQAESTNRYAALDTYINWVGARVHNININAEHDLAERDARIAELEKALNEIGYLIHDFAPEIMEYNDELAAQIYVAASIANEALKSEVK